MWRPGSVAACWVVVGALVSSVMGLNRGDTKSIPLRTHTLSQPYLDSDMQNRWWDFGGDTLVRVDKYIRLTSDKPSRDGWIFSRVPLTATNWEIEVEFAIHGDGHLHGDGMAMWITKQRAQQGQVFGSVDKFEGLGIFFDTYKNNRPGTVFPYVMLMVGDGQTTYDKANDGQSNEWAGCSARGIRGATEPTKARLTYYQEKSLKLELQFKPEGEWTVCFDRDDPPTIPAVSYLGFSAETGELSDNHDIINVQTKNLYSTSSISGLNNAGKKPGMGSARQRDKGVRPPKQKGSWTWFFIKIALFCLVAGGGYVGFTIYRTQAKRSRF